MTVRLKYSFLAFLLALAGCTAAGQQVSTGSVSSGQPAMVAQRAPLGTSTPAPLARWTVLKQFPHDPGAFTQGLLWHNGNLYESTGLEGQSSVRRVELNTGQVLQRKDFPAPLFGEGLALANGQFYFLTWQNRVAFEMDATFKVNRRFRYTNEGWGLTYDGTQLIHSDGTDTLTFRDPASFAATRSVRVTWDGKPATNLNELEYIEGKVWANVWQTDIILIINPDNGKVERYLDMTGLLPVNDRLGGEDVLNGIAYDATNKRIFVTGKKWPRLYWIAVPAEEKGTS